MTLQITKTACRMLYAGTLAYTISACAPQYLPSRAQKTALHSEKENVEVGLQYAGATQEWVAFSTVISNYSDEAVMVSPEKIYMTNTKPLEKHLPNLPAINPEAKIREYQNRIIKRKDANEAGKTLLIVLGVVIIVGLLVVAIAADAKDAKTSSTNTPRNSNSTNSNSNTWQSAQHNTCQDFEPSALRSTLDFLGHLTVTIASIQRQERGYVTMTGIQKLEFMQKFWENEALRHVMLQPNQRVQGIVFFPRNKFKTNQFEVVVPLANAAHLFPFTLPARW